MYPALVTCDERRARHFAERELRGLDFEAPRDRVLMTTAPAYFEAGQNATSAAARLRVHDQTVTNRIRALERRIGRTLTDRQTELQVAMRIALLGPEQPAGSPGLPWRDASR